MMAQKAIDDDVIRNNLICPYSHITTDVDISDGNVFLDYGDEVDIMIRATPSSAIPSHLFSLAIIDSLLDYVNGEGFGCLVGFKSGSKPLDQSVSLIKDVKESSLTTIAYRLRLSDSRLYHEQSGSGRSMRNTPIRLIAFDTSGACKQLNYDSNTAQTSRSSAQLLSTIIIASRILF
uniref:Uncharacterized protein n=1 Tax=Spongospora subterranea TaxID=70186 RepID=A0A0H5R935_9EUKA|eukprot:CRZ04904.1 hypothetical protein [Spongospora subterranea]